MSVYKIDYKSILFIDEKTTSSKNNVDASDLDKVIGFDPRLRLSEVDELKNIYFKDSKGKEIKCPVLKSLSSSIIAKCNGNEYNFMKSTIKSKKLESGALIYAENPYTNKIVYINNTPAVIGLVTRRGCEDSTKVCIIELDLLQVSYDLNESTDQQADWVSY